MNGISASPSNRQHSSAISNHSSGITRPPTFLNFEDAAEHYYRNAIEIGQRQYASDQVTLITSQENRSKDSIASLLQCLEAEQKSISLKEKLIIVYMAIYEYEPAIYESGYAIVWHRQ
mmetsp:Transcript_50216/g.83620  ORF Transcript_50216/g.83620 Transcript_50216/m.83620 type:complete len:118 (-) Transcript_50216:2-355(-)